MPPELREAVGVIANAYLAVADKSVYAVWRTDNGPKGRDFRQHELTIHLTSEGPMFFEKIIGTEGELKDISFIGKLDDYEGVKDAIDVFWTYDVDIARELYRLEKERYRIALGL